MGSVGTKKCEDWFLVFHGLLVYPSEIRFTQIRDVDVQDGV